MCASVNLRLHHKVQKFSSGTGSPGWSQKRAVKRLWCGDVVSVKLHNRDHILNVRQLKHGCKIIMCILVRAGNVNVMF